MARTPTAKQKYDKKTGKVVAKDAKKMRTAKKAAHALKGKPKSAAHRLAISKGIKLSYKTGKTKAGRKRKAPGRNKNGMTWDKWKTVRAKVQSAVKKNTAKKSTAAKAKTTATKAKAKPAAKPAATGAKKRGRPPGSKNKPKAAAAAPAAKKRGRPAGSKNKPKAAPAKSGRKARSMG